MREVSLFVNNQKLDLFKDEEISITSTIQNVQDISKVFTDFSQTFTVPCSKNNNSIFEHYYNSDVDATFSAQNRQTSRIEINNTIFRTGLLQLESAELKGLDSDNYKVTFYGDVTTLKDLFSNDKLSDLDLGLNVEYDETTVVDSVTDLGIIDVRFPLISSNRLWQYGGGGANDISTVGGKINYAELFPAVRDAVIFEAIENKYNIEFTGLFLNSSVWDNSYTWWKNRKLPNFTNQAVPINFAVGGTVPLNDGIFTLQYIEPVTYAPSGAVNPSTRKFVNIYLTCDITSTYYIDIYYKNKYLTTGYETENFFQSTITVNATAGVQQNIQLINGGPFTTGDSNYDREYTWKIRSIDEINLTGSIRLNITGNYILAGVNTNVAISSTTIPIVALATSNLIDFSSSAPDISIADYFKGKLNQFNLTCYPKSSELKFQIEPIPEWYIMGRDIDITPYVDTDTIQIERIKLYKNISFEYQESKNFLNVQFKENANRGYGDLKTQFDYDGGDFTIKLPFENPLFNRFTGTELQVSYSMTDAIQDADKSNVPKCTSLYLDASNYDCDFYLGSSHITHYQPFGQDFTLSGSTDYSLNFGSEQSSLKDEIIDNSLFLVYYFPYLTSLFNPKARRVKVKTRLPLSLLTDITLDMKVIIRDKKYLIEEMKSNLSTGEVDFVLIHDFIPRGFVGNGGVTAPAEEEVIVSASIVIPENNQGLTTSYATIEAPAETQFVTTTPVLPEDITASTNFEFTVPINGTGVERTNTIPIVYKNLDGTVIRTDFFVITQESGRVKLTGGGLQLLTNTLIDLTE